MRRFRKKSASSSRATIGSQWPLSRCHRILSHALPKKAHAEEAYVEQVIREATAPASPETAPCPYGPAVS